MSHTQSMENMENKPNANAPTKANTGLETGLVLSPTDAEEYRAYKKQKKIGEIMSALAKTETPIELKSSTERVCEHAIRLRQAAVRVNLRKLMQMQNRFANTVVKLDCVIGGDGEAVTKLKAREIRLARRSHAGEVTVMLPPSLLNACRYQEIKKELRKLKRAAGKTVFKVCMGNNYPYSTVASMARVACDIGAQYFSVPHFAGCEKLRCDLTGGCKLEVSEVENLADFKKMTEAGVGRVLTSRVWELYSEWMREAETITAPAPEQEKNLPVRQDPPKPPLPAGNKALENKLIPQPLALQSRKNAETDYRCRLEGTELKFY